MEPKAVTPRRPSPTIDRYAGDTHLGLSNASSPELLTLTVRLPRSSVDSIQMHTSGSSSVAASTSAEMRFCR